MAELVHLGDDMLTIVLRHCTLLSLYRVKQTCRPLSAIVGSPMMERARKRLGWDACRMQCIGKRRSDFLQSSDTPAPLPAVGEECSFKYPQQAQRLDSSSSSSSGSDSGSSASVALFGVGLGWQCIGGLEATVL